MKNFKGSFFTRILLIAAVAEALIIAYGALRPADSNKPAVREIAVPELKIAVPSFAFENDFVPQVDERLAEVAADMDDTLIKKIAEYQPSDAAKAEEKPAEVSTEAAAEVAEVAETAPEPTAASPAVVPAKTVLAKDKKYIAVVMDDLGINVANSKEILAMNDKPLTVSFLTYGDKSRALAEEAKAAGFEVMLHIPMMPQRPVALAPNTLSPSMSKETVQKQLREMLAKLDGLGVRGVNNHMGSLFTENRRSMGYIMEILREKGLYFLDSKTTGKSVGKYVSKEYGVPYIARDVFLDNENDYKYIMGQFKQAEQVAQKHGAAVAIGHPYSQTIKALRDWLKTAEERGFTLVYAADLVR